MRQGGQWEGGLQVVEEFSYDNSGRLCIYERWRLHPTTTPTRLDDTRRAGDLHLGRRRGPCLRRQLAALVQGEPNGV
jgi:hypothetical protein